jgi:hypothetical protein
MYHPWLHLRSLAELVIHWARPSADAPGATDGGTVIWLDPRLLQVERRCVLTHELVHVERGHRGCQPPAVETLVRRETALRLISLEALLEQARWTREFVEMAHELWVTEQILTDRIGALTPGEWQLIIEATSHHTP